jgi:outer membrane receptor protein involved in Fe transport
VSGRFHLFDSLRVEVGGRYQTYPDAALGQQLLGSAALLWTPVEGLYVKAGAAMGYRPPTLENVLKNNDPLTNTLPSEPSNPDVGSEKSTAAEVEVSTLMLRDTSGIRYLRLSAGYQYTVLDDLIVDIRGIPENAATRILHTGDLRADLRFKDGMVNLAYSTFYGYDRDTGELRNVANHKLFIGAQLPLTNHLYFATGLTVYGPREDLNRGVIPGAVEGTFRAPPSDVVVDRIAPVAMLRASLVWESLWNEKLELGIYANNLLDDTFYVPDEEFERRVAIFSVTAPGLSVMAGATLRL